MGLSSLNIDFTYTPVMIWNLLSDKPICINQGGTYSSKTRSIIKALFLKGIEKKRNILVTSTTFPILSGGAMQDAEEFINESPIISSAIQSFNKTKHIYKLHNGTRIIFRAFDKESKAKGNKFNIIFADEVNTLPQGVFKQLFLRFDEQLYAAYNSDAHFWLHDLMASETWQGQYDFFISNVFEHNPFATKQTLRNILSYKDTDPERFKVYGLGLTGQAAGVVFRNVERCEEFPRKCDRYVYGLDFGYSNSYTALVKCGYFAGALYGDELIYERGLQPTHLVSEVQRLGVSKRDIIVADPADPAYIDALRDAGYTIVEAMKPKGSIKTGIALINSYQLYISNRSANWWKEALSYKYRQNDSSNEPIKQSDHCWDAARYGFGFLLAEENYTQPTPRTKLIA